MSELRYKVEPGKWFAITLTHKPTKRKDDFEPYCEPFRPLNEEEIKSIFRTVDLRIHLSDAAYSDYLVSYQAFPGGFTICNILLDNKLYSGSSHCVKTDRWLPIRGKMQAFRRAIEQSEGVELPQEKYFESDGLVYESTSEKGDTK